MKPILLRLLLAGLMILNFQLSQSGNRKPVFTSTLPKQITGPKLDLTLTPVSPTTSLRPTSLVADAPEPEKPLHTLTATLQANIEEYRYGWTSIASQDSYYWLSLNQYDPNSLSDSIELPEGEYTIVAQFIKQDPTVLNYMGGQVFVVLQLNLTGDDHVILDPSTATNHITAPSYTPDGELPKLPTLHTMSDDQIEYEPGNVNFLTIRTSLFHKENGGLYTISTSAEYERSSEEGLFPDSNIFKCSEIWINDVSDDIAITQCQFASTDENGFYYTEMTPIFGISDSMEGVYSREYEKPYVMESQLSIAGEESVKNGYERVYTCLAYILQPNLKELICFNEGTGYSHAPILWVAGINQLQGTSETLLSIQYSDVMQQSMDNQTENSGEFLIYFTRTMPLRFNPDHSIETVYTPQTGQYQRSQGKELIRFVSCPALSFYNSQCEQIIGNSQPSISFLSYQEYDWEEEKDMWKLSAIPYGRLGELREGDTAVMDYSETEETMNGTTLKTMGISLSNQIIDGIRGVTTASFTLDPMKTIAPPVLRQLQFRNTEGEITDRFNSASEGRFLISTATYTQQSNPMEQWNWWYDVTPCSTSVSVSPYGLQRWVDIETTELTEDYEAAFGNIYEGSLASVDMVSANGWYDMKIELESKDGAVSSQIISPAFKIDKGAEVKNTNADSLGIVMNGGYVFVPGEPDASLIVYTMDGRVIAAQEGAIAVASLPAGIYLIRSGNHTTKITLHN